MNLDLTFPVSEQPPPQPPRLDNEAYLEFVEFNLHLLQQNGEIERIMESRARPVADFFVLPGSIPGSNAGLASFPSSQIKASPQPD